VLAPAFHWARGDVNQAFGNGVICSNCDKLKVYIDGAFALEAEPDRMQFAHLKYLPFTVDLERHLQHWGDLRIEGYVAGKLAITRTFSGKYVDQKFLLLPDDTELVADGADTTRVGLRVTDEFDAVRPFESDAIRFELRGPAVIIGDNPMPLVGGTSAIWIRATEQPGKVILIAHHPHLGTQTVEFQMLQAATENV
jgi:beta-galactosidase